MSARRTYRSRRTTVGPTYRPSSRALWHPLRRHPRARVFPIPPEPGTDFLPGELPGARMLVEIAFGADLTADEGTWTWTDVTEYVRYRESIVINVGKSGESGQAPPASCVMTLDNSDNLFSPHNPLSPNWPNVKRNTPVRIQLRTTTPGTYFTRFQGGAAAWRPQWDTTGVNVTTVLESAGTLRRLEQGNAPVVSTLRKALSAASGVHAYWPCEETKGATIISSGLENGTPMLISSSTETPFPNWEATTDFVCSAPLPEIAGTTWRGAVPVHTTTNNIQVRFLLGVPPEGVNDTIELTLMSVYTTGTVARWDLRAHPTGGLSLEGYNTDGNFVLNTAEISFAINGSRRRISLELVQDGANIDYRFSTVPVDDFSNGGLLHEGTLNTHTVGRATAVDFNRFGFITNTVIGHITVESAITSLYVDQASYNARLGELGFTRVTRLCSEAGISAETIGTDNGPNMGGQGTKTLLELLREVETANGGILHDGLSSGLRYVGHVARYARAADLTLDQANRQLFGPLEPIDDDQATRNDITVKNARGTQYQVRQISGPLGTDSVDVYDTSLDVVTLYNRSALDIAGWRLNMGTVPGFRHPRLSLNLRRNPELADDWLAITMASRIDVENIDDNRPAHPPGTISLMVEGWTEVINQIRWDVTVNCSPYTPHRVGLVPAARTDTGEFILRATDSGTSTLLTTYAQGSSSVQVVTTAGSPLWTTTAADCPLTAVIDGILVEVTAISGGSSPQTFTVTSADVVRDLAGGAAVTLHEPGRLAKG